MCEYLSVGRCEDYVIVIALCLKCGYTSVHRLYLHDHARLAAERIVIHFTVFVRAVVAQIVHYDLGQTLVLGALQYGTGERPLQHFGDYGEYVYSHQWSFFSVCKINTKASNNSARNTF